MIDWFFHKRLNVYEIWYTGQLINTYYGENKPKVFFLTKSVDNLVSLFVW